MSEESSTNLLEKVRKAGLNRWRLETWAKTIGIQGLQAGQQESERNQRAENRAVRQKMWGNDGEESEGDVGGHTYLGDVQYPAPIIMQQPAPAPQKSSILGPLLLGALAATGPVGAGAALLMSQMQKAPAPAVQPAGSVVNNNTREELELRILDPSEVIGAPVGR